MPNHPSGDFVRAGKGRLTDAAMSELSQAEIKAIELKRTGMSYDEIARVVVDQHGNRVWNSRNGPWRAVKKNLEVIAGELRDETINYRAESVGRLEELLKACWSFAMSGSYQHIAEARKLIVEISKLTGALTVVQVQIGESDVDAALRELDAEIDRRSRSIEGEVVPDPGAPGDDPPADLG